MQRKDLVPPYYITVLVRELKLIQNRNKSFSLRAFARKLDVSPGVLSSIMNGKRTLTKAIGLKILKKLNISEEEKTQFLKSINYSPQYLNKLEEKIKKQKVLFLEDNSLSLKILSEWEHHAVLVYMELKEFSPKRENISKKLGIPMKRLMDVLDNLVEAKLIIRKKDDYFPSEFDCVSFRFNENSESTNIIKKESLKLAFEKYDQQDENLSHTTSWTIPVETKNLQKAKELMDEFIVRLHALLQDGECTEVYKATFTLFPLSISSNGSMQKTTREYSSVLEKERLNAQERIR